MGTLVAMRYPTKLALGAADHTYVKCDTGGRAWGCWGGKTGGTALRQGTGSTAQANAIAEPDERARIKCYLINGVCHQAANRILFPAGILVIGARGYGLSESIYGPYGRLSGPFGSCPSPIDHHTGVTGDLPECVPGPTQLMQPEQVEHPQPPDERERRYVGDVADLYAKAEGAGIAALGAAAPDHEDFMIQLFVRKVAHNLGAKIGKPAADRLRQHRIDVERARKEIDDGFSRGKISAVNFVAALDEQVHAFQKKTAETLAPTHYQALLDLKPGELVTLADPDIVEKEFGKPA